MGYVIFPPPQVCISRRCTRGGLTASATLRLIVKGYILIKLVLGLESDALLQIRATQGVLEVNLVFGQRDAIAIAKAKALFELAKVVVGEVRGIQGVQDTTTLVESEI